MQTSKVNFKQFFSNPPLHISYWQLRCVLPFLRTKLSVEAALHLKILRPKEELDEGYETPEHVSQTAQAPGLGLQHLITFIYQQSKNNFDCFSKISVYLSNICIFI